LAGYAAFGLKKAPAKPGQEGRATLAVPVHASDDDVTVKTSLPGVKPERVYISLAGDTLAIKREMCGEKETKSRMMQRTRAWGSPL
jgi:HSP20 family molecular chaperone IbpA